MNIVYGCDDNFAPVLYVSVATLIKYNKKSKLNIYVIDDHISTDKKNAINKLMTIDHKIFWLPMIDIKKEIGSELQLDRGSSAQFARIFIDRYLPKSIDRVLYLDCDTMPISSIKELWEMDLENATFGACLDAFSKFYSRNLKLSKNADLINSGVLLIDLYKWRSRSKEQKAIETLRKNNGKLQQADQGLLDILVQDDLRVLNPKFNCINGYFEFSYTEWIKYRKPTSSYTEKYTEPLIRDALENPVIVHFTSSFLNDRPWIIGSENPYTDDWLMELSKSTLTMNLVKKKSLLKRIFKKLPRRWAIKSYGILQAYLRPLLKKT